jgi:uncharacterized protein (DUF433 family)
MTYKDRIIQDPEVLAGKPIVKGTRVSVETVLWFLAETPNVDELLQAYPRLTIDDVKACLAYAEAKVRLTRNRRGSATAASA